MTRRESIRSTSSISTISTVSSTATISPPWCIITTSKRHVTQYLYPLLLLASLGIIPVLIGCGIWYNSLGLLAHSLHMCFNWLLIFVLTVCVFINWVRTKRYQPTFTTNAQRFNIFLGGSMLISSMALIGASIWNIMYPPEIQFFIDAVLIPVPSFFLNMLNIYIIKSDYDGEKKIKQKNLSNGQIKKARKNAQHSKKAGRKNIKTVTVHIKTATVGSILTLGISSVVHTLELVLADAIMSIVNALLMLPCAVYLITTSYKSLVEQKKNASELEDRL